MTEWEATITEVLADSQSTQDALIKSVLDPSMSPFQLLHLGELALQVSCIPPTRLCMRLTNVHCRPEIFYIAVSRGGIGRLRSQTSCKALQRAGVTATSQVHGSERCRRMRKA